MTSSDSAHNALLDAPLTILSYPTRLEWAITRLHLRTVRDLVLVHPETLRTERNCGPRTIEDTRRALERYLGTTWEEANANAARRTPAKEEALELPDAVAELSPRACLPRHIAKRCLQEGLHTMRDVVRARHLLQLHRRMSRKSLALLDEAIRDLTRGESVAP